MTRSSPANGGGDGDAPPTSDDEDAGGAAPMTSNGPSSRFRGRPTLAFADTAQPAPAPAQSSSQRRRGACQSIVGMGMVGGFSSRRQIGGMGPSILNLAAGSTRNLGGAGGAGGQSGDLASVNIPNIPEGGAVEDDLHRLFRTCVSISEIRESFYLEVEQGRGVSCCSVPDDYSSRLLLHSIGLNKCLIVESPGGLALVDDFILNELLPTYPAAIVEEDDEGHWPFMEVLVDWIRERRDARRRRGPDSEKKGLADMVQDAAKVFFSSRSVLGPENAENGSVAAAATAREEDANAAGAGLYDLPPLVEWSLRMLSTIVGRPPTPSPFRKRGLSNASTEQSKKNASDTGIVEASYDSLFVINQEGTIEMVNEAAVKEFGWTMEEFMGGNISMICGGGHGPRHDAYLKRYLKTGEKRVMGVKGRKLFAKRRDGSEFPIELGITETGGRGQPRRFCGFVRHRKTDEAAESSDGSIDPLLSPSASLRTSLHRVEEDSQSDLSFLMDPNTPSKLGVTLDQGAVYDELIVEKLASIPHIVEELLLIEDSAARERIFDLSIIRKVLLCSESFGNGGWLMNMLNVRSGCRGTTSRRRSDLSDCEDIDDHETIDLVECAVFYLERISQLTPNDDVTDHVNTRLASEGAMLSFRQKRNGLFDQIGNLEGLIRTLCTLENEMLKRSAVTRAIQRMLDRTIFSPFALSEALSDGMFHVTFICAFRLGPAEAMFHLSPTDAAFRPQQYIVSTVILVGCIVYFSMKTTHLSLAKRASTPELFWRQVTNPLNAIGVVTILMVTYCMFTVDSILRGRALGVDEERGIPFGLRIAVALTTPLLWLRILGHIKMFNKQLATFILCSQEILNDIKWFLLVLLIAISSFAQMIVSLTFDPLSHPDSDLEYQYFSLEGYLKAYTTMLGDIDSASLQKHPSMVVLFVLYTFGVTIVLLNILIAIVSESYVNAVYASTVMLGKARVMFVADILSMKQFHSMLMWKRGGVGGSTSNFGDLGYFASAFDVGCLAFALYSTKLAVATVKAKLASLQGPSVGGFLGLSSLDIKSGILLIVVVGTIVAQRLFTIYLLDSFEKGGFPGVEKMDGSSSGTKFLGVLTQALRAYFSRNIDILTEDDADIIQEGCSAQTDGAATLTAVQGGSDYKTHRAVAACRKELKAEIKRSSDQLRHILQEAENKSQSDILHCEENLTSALAESQEWVASALAASEERIINAITLQLEEKFCNRETRPGSESSPTSG